MPLQILVNPEEEGYINPSEAVSEKLKTEKGLHSEKQHFPEEIQGLLFCRDPDHHRCSTLTSSPYLSVITGKSTDLIVIVIL